MLIPKIKHNVCTAHLQTAKMKFNISITQRNTLSVSSSKAIRHIKDIIKNSIQKKNEMYKE